MSSDEEVLVKVSVSNTSDVKGKEVVQLYVKDVESSIERPIKELKGFRKVELAAEETKELVFKLTSRDFSYWDETTGGWQLESGTFEIIAASSSHAPQLKTTINIQ